VAVLDGGRIVEEGTTEQVFTQPATPLTRALLEAVPGLRFHPEAPQEPSDG